MRSFRLGSVLGFEIRLDASWFILFFLILWTFTAAVFPAGVPGQRRVVYLVMGVIGTVLFFGSLVAHEVAHSIVARRRGIPMEGITLFIFGGMAKIRAESRNPRDEFLIAGVGPLTSLGIGLVFGGVAGWGLQAGWPAPVVVVAWHLAILNVALAVFNLLPGFPLDGGRLLRAAVWKRTGSLTRATRVASGAGRWFGLLLVALGIVQIFTVNLVGGVWLVLIGMFLRTAAESSYLQVLLASSLEGSTAEDIMTPDPITVPAETSLEAFVERFLLEGRHLGYPVVDGEAVVGLISLNEVKKFPRGEWASRTVGGSMTPLSEGIVVPPGEGHERVLEKLQSAPAGRLLVMEGDAVLGIVTRSDLARLIARARLLEPEEPAASPAVPPR